MSSEERICRDIENTKARIDRTLYQLSQHLSPKRLYQDVLDSSVARLIERHRGTALIVTSGIGWVVMSQLGRGSWMIFEKVRPRSVLSYFFWTTCLASLGYENYSARAKANERDHIVPRENKKPIFIGIAGGVVLGAVVFSLLKKNQRRHRELLPIY